MQTQKCSQSNLPKMALQDHRGKWLLDAALGMGNILVVSFVIFLSLCSEILFQIYGYELSALDLNVVPLQEHISWIKN